MSKRGFRIAKEIKEQIINRIKNDGVSVSQASADHGVSVKTIYAWLGTGTKSVVSVIEYNKLKKENNELKQIIGTLAIKLSTEAKKGHLVSF
jgi:transposase-like protein